MIPSFSQWPGGSAIYDPVWLTRSLLSRFSANLTGFWLPDDSNGSAVTARVGENLTSTNALGLTETYGRKRWSVSASTGKALTSGTSVAAGQVIAVAAPAALPFAANAYAVSAGASYPWFAPSAGTSDWYHWGTTMTKDGASTYTLSTGLHVYSTQQSATGPMFIGGLGAAYPALDFLGELGAVIRLTTAISSGDLAATIADLRTFYGGAMP